eukprot:2345681-Amphidinium_carterae.1
MTSRRWRQKHATKKTQKLLRSREEIRVLLGREQEAREELAGSTTSSMVHGAFEDAEEYQKALEDKDHDAIKRIIFKYAAGIRERKLQWR